MKKVLTDHKKYGLVIGYILVALLAWSQRYALVGQIPTFIRERLSDLTLTLIFLSLVLIGLVCLVQLLRLSTGIFQKRKFQEAFESAGLKNHMGKYPTLLSKKTDKNKQYGAIYEFNNVGLSMADFDDNKASLETTLNLKIYALELGDKAKATLIYAIPRKYAKPFVLSPDDGYVGSDDVDSLINMLIVGATGTGKTVAMKALMAKIAKFQPSAKFWVLDFKQYDFKEFADSPNYYGYLDCEQGLQDFYNAFKEQQAKGVAGTPQYLFVDEWGSFILSLEKKKSDELKTRLSEILVLARTYKFVPIIGLQRADASYFVSGARDSFRKILMLGNLSKEQKQMLAPDVKDSMTDNNSLGEGYLLIDGKGIERVKVVVDDFESVGDTIRQAMNR